MLSIKSQFVLFLITLKKISGKRGFEILRNKKPEISTTSGFDIVLYYYSKNVPNREALPP
jgi:methyltransferase-like protein